MSVDQIEYDRFRVRGAVTITVGGKMASKGRPSQDRVEQFLASEAPTSILNVDSVAITDVKEIKENEDIIEHYE